MATVDKEQSGHRGPDSEKYWTCCAKNNWWNDWTLTLSGIVARSGNVGTHRKGVTFSTRSKHFRTSTVTEVVSARVRWDIDKNRMSVWYEGHCTITSRRMWESLEDYSAFYLPYSEIRKCARPVSVGTWNEALQRLGFGNFSSDKNT